MIVDLIIKVGRGGLTHDISMTKGEKKMVSQENTVFVTKIWTVTLMKIIIIAFVRSVFHHSCEILPDLFIFLYKLI